MKFLRVKVKSSNDMANPGSETNGRIETIVLFKSIIWLLLILISINHAFLSITPITMNRCKSRIKFELKLSYEAYDLLRSFNNLGSLLGAIIFTLIIEKINHKHTLISFLLINCICHFSFYLKLPFLVLLISRFISGLVTSYCTIYFPFWVDKFGINNWIGFMQALVQISKIFGVSIGYSLFSILGNRNWNYFFLIESVLVTIVTFLMYLIPSDYYDKRYIDMERENKIDINIDEKVEKETVIKDIFFNIPFLLLQFYRGKIIFINQANRYYYSNQLDSAIFGNEKNFVFHSYLFNTVLSSFLGIITGSLILIMIGGQNSKHSFLCLFYLQLLSCFLGFLSNKYDSTVFFNIMICLFNYFNSACGIISINVSFSLMAKSLKGISCGILNIIHNLIGILPAFKGYKLIKNYVGEKGIINVLMLYGLIGCIELMVADIYIKFNKVKLGQKY